MIAVPFGDEIPNGYIEIMRDKNSIQYPIPRDGTNGNIYCVPISYEKYIYNKELIK